MTSLNRKQCTKCGQRKSRAAFGARSGASDGLQAQCKECRRATDLAYREKIRATREPKPKEPTKAAKQRAKPIATSPSDPHKKALVQLVRNHMGEFRELVERFS